MPWTSSRSFATNAHLVRAAVAVTIPECRYVALLLTGDVDRPLEPHGHHPGIPTRPREDGNLEAHRHLQVPEEALRKGPLSRSLENVWRAFESWRFLRGDWLGQDDAAKEEERKGADKRCAGLHDVSEG